MSPMTRANDCVSDLKLDELLAGELSPDATREAQHHIEVCATCRGRRDARVAARNAFLAWAPSWTAYDALTRTATARAADTTQRTTASAPAEASLVPVPARPGPLRRRPRFGLAVAAALAAALSMVVVLRPPAPETTPAVRSKGAPHLSFFVKRDGRVFAGTRDTVVHPGDRLRFTYAMPETAHVAVIGRDPQGASIYFPRDAGRARQLPAGAGRPLPFAVELDASLGEEAVYGFFCRTPARLSALRDAVATGAPPPAAAGCLSDRLVLTKAPRP